MVDTKISALTAASAAAGANELAINEAGTSKKLTVAQIETYLRSYATVTQTVSTGQFKLGVKQVSLAGAARLTLLGTARLRVT